MPRLNALNHQELKYYQNQNILSDLYISLKALLTICLLVVVFSSNAQSNYVKGSIVTKDNQIIEGEIDYKNWKRNPSKINFKKTLNSEPESFTPSDILSFSVKDDYYISAEVQKEMSSFQLTGLSFDPQFEFTTVQAFLRRIVSGDKELYYHFDTNKGDFYTMDNGELVHLRYRRYYHKKNGKKQIRENREYVTQLQEYLGECPDIWEYLKDAEYRLNSFRNLFEEYHKCVGTNGPSIVQKEKTISKFGITAGLSRTNLAFTGSIGYLGMPDYSASLNPTIGVSLDLVLPRNHRKWSMNNDLILTIQNHSATHVEGSENRRITYNTTFNYNYVRLSNMVRYRLNISDTRVFLGLGISNGVAISADDMQQVTTSIFGVESQKDVDSISGSKSHEFAISTSIGLTRNMKYGVELRAELGNGVTNLITTSSKSTRLYVLGTYYL